MWSLCGASNLKWCYAVTLTPCGGAATFSALHIVHPLTCRLGVLLVPVRVTSADHCHYDVKALLTETSVFYFWKQNERVHAKVRWGEGWTVISRQQHTKFHCWWQYTHPMQPFSRIMVYFNPVWNPTCCFVICPDPRIPGNCFREISPSKFWTCCLLPLLSHVYILRALEELPWAVRLTVMSDPLLCCLLLYLSPEYYGLCQPSQSARDAIECSSLSALMNGVARRL